MKDKNLQCQTLKKVRQMSNTSTITTELLKLYKEQAWEAGVKAGIRIQEEHTIILGDARTHQMYGNKVFSVARGLVAEFKQKLKQEFLSGC